MYVYIYIYIYIICFFPELGIWGTPQKGLFASSGGEEKKGETLKGTLGDLWGLYETI